MSLGLESFAGIGLFTATLIFILAIWSIVWKGFALWIAAREGAKYWFIPLLIFNTAGILEIIYILFFSEKGKNYLQGWRTHRAHKKAHKAKKHAHAKEVEEVKE